MVYYYKLIRRDSMCKLTIHTATYNRAYILRKAYESLKAQTCKDFEWIITDDGSNDSTEELVNSWIKQNNGFPIIYNKLNHVGIPRALNSGVNRASTQWFMMLDSDDYLLPETVEKVMAWLEEIQNDERFAGVGFARCYPDGRYMKKQEPCGINEHGYFDATHLERKDHRIDMDMCEVHRTELFKKYPFQYWENESYAPEQLNFNQIAFAGYKLRWRLDKLYICEYLPGGQTMDDGLVKRNPMGFAMMHNQNLLINKSFFENCKSVIYMIALCLYASYPEYLKHSNKKVLTYLLFPLGWLLSLRRKRQFRAMN